MYAIFRAKGKQFRAEPEMRLRIPSFDAEPGERITFDEVLLGSSDGDVVIGTPDLAGASVEAEVVRHGKDDKIVVYKMKRRKGYRRKQGHRQKFTEIRIVKIDLGAAPGRPRATAKPETEPAEAPEEPTSGKAEAPESPSVVEPEAVLDVDVTDAARRLAEEHGLDLSTVEGTGVEGRILKGDVQKAIKAREAAEAEDEAS